MINNLYENMPRATELVFQENMDGWTSQDLNPIKHNGV